MSLHAQSLALVYDPELENPKDGERTPRRDPALRRAALSFYADMSDMRCETQHICMCITSLACHSLGIMSGIQCSASKLCLGRQSGLSGSSMPEVKSTGKPSLHRLTP